MTQKLQLHNPLKRMILTQGFGRENTAPGMLKTYEGMGLQGHNGHDYIAWDGTPVYASHDGRVTFAGYDGSGGLGVVIRTEQPYFYDTEKEQFISEEEAIKRGYKE